MIYDENVDNLETHIWLDLLTTNQYGEFFKPCSYLSERAAKGAPLVSSGTDHIFYHKINYYSLQFSRLKTFYPKISSLCFCMNL